MPRKNLVRTERTPYHVTSRTYSDEFFKIPMDEVWSYAKESLRESFDVHKIELVSFVLMSNHYHMILVTPNKNLDQFMYEFNKRFAMKIKKASLQEEQVFKGRYRWSLIRSMKYYANCYKYVYQNPLRAGLIRRVEDYPYSTLRYLISGENFSLPIHDRFGFKDFYNLDFLNRKLEENELFDIRKKLRRYIAPR